MPISDLLIILILSSAVCALVKLAWVDLKSYILPNGYILVFIGCGLTFHLLTLYEYVTLQDAMLGGFIGFASLLFIRQAAAMAGYKNALGMGDVKLMLGAGIWLGSHYILLALIAGSLAGIVHGLVMRVAGHNSAPLALTNVPAGPGFVIGILGVMAYMLRSLPQFMSAGVTG